MTLTVTQMLRCRLSRLKDLITKQEVGFIAIFVSARINAAGWITATDDAATEGDQHKDPQIYQQNKNEVRFGEVAWQRNGCEC